MTLTKIEQELKKNGYKEFGFPETNKKRAEGKMWLQVYFGKDAKVVGHQEPGKKRKIYRVWYK